MITKNLFLILVFLLFFSLQTFAILPPTQPEPTKYCAFQLQGEDPAILANRNIEPDYSNTCSCYQEEQIIEWRDYRCSEIANGGLIQIATQTKLISPNCSSQVQETIYRTIESINCAKCNPSQVLNEYKIQGCLIDGREIESREVLAINFDSKVNVCYENKQIEYKFTDEYFSWCKTPFNGFVGENGTSNLIILTAGTIVLVLTGVYLLFFRK